MRCDAGSPLLWRSVRRSPDPTRWFGCTAGPCDRHRHVRCRSRCLPRNPSTSFINFGAFTAFTLVNLAAIGRLAIGVMYLLMLTRGLTGEPPDLQRITATA